MVRLTGPLNRLYSGPMPASHRKVGRPSAARAGRPPAAGADFLQLDPAGVPARGLTGWLAGELRSGIRDGRLPAGTVLPATRLLAGDLGVSRGVIVEAYRQLTDEGLVSARQGAGTVVLPRTPPPGADPGAPGGQAVAPLCAR
jgi:GntR family transcriptional regulator / MocR family aminotransferase